MRLKSYIAVDYVARKNPMIQDSSDYFAIAHI